MAMKKSDIMNLMKKIHSGTPGTGMRDDVPATINGSDPAALSEGEYVIPADVVSMLGDGHSDAGAKILDAFIKEIRMTKGKALAKGQQAGPLTKLAKMNNKKG
jgi:hypothetical protein